MPHPIDGLPEGAELRPIQGLPPGAELRPVQRPGVSGAGPGETIPPPAGSKVASPGTFPMIPHTKDMSIPQHVGTAAMNTLSGAGNAITQTFAHPIDSLMNVGKLAIDPVLATFDPKDSISQQLGHSLAENPAQTVENLLGGYLAGKGIGLAGKGASAVGESGIRATNPQTPASIAAAADKPWNNLAGKIGPLTGGMARSPQIENLAAALRKRVPEIGTTGARNPLEYSKAVDNYRTNVAIPEYAKIRSPMANEPIGATALSDRLKNYVVPHTGQPLGPNPSIAQSDQALNNLNEVTSKSYLDSPSINNTEALMGRTAMADELRSKLNPRMGELAGLPAEEVGNLRSRMGETGSIADNARLRSMANHTGVDPASAAAGGNTARSMGARALRSTVLEPIENWQFRRALNKVESNPQGVPEPPMGPIKSGIIRGGSYGLKGLGQGMQAAAPLTPVQSMVAYIRSLRSANTENQ